MIEFVIACLIASVFCFLMAIADAYDDYQLHKQKDRP